MILIVEDEIAISRVLSAYLQKAEFTVEHAYDGEEALAKFDQLEPELVLLDVMLPKGDGWEVLKQIRSKSPCPVIMITALGKLDERLTGLDHGADDYISKPFEPKEVVARVRAVLRRYNQILEEKDAIYYGGLKLDFHAHIVTLHGEKLELTPRDLSLLLFLAKNPNQAFTREQLLDHVWGTNFDGSDRSVDLAVKRLRKALCKWSKKEGEIVTLRGVGYQLYVHSK
ncbi:response regulator transcription factor [Shimazuella sp. AN120528]|uniref:response regulator transcription factor n=1 Tax=Shimazuella soli TaxID=1892854 RepID=UPI001F0F1E1B|nr:response regulator transcription factor [Shimazuella soli]MCH5584711.1 response regulator transcription factor [Shimazuella soli]